MLKSRNIKRVAAAAVAGLAYVPAVFLTVTPIVVAAEKYGSIVSFVFFALLYGVGSYVAAALIMKRFDMKDGDDAVRRAERHQAWMEEHQKDQIGRLLVKALEGGSIIGFLASTFWLGAIVTTLGVRAMGLRSDMKRVNLVASISFALMVPGLYSGVWYHLASKF